MLDFKKKIIKIEKNGQNVLVLGEHRKLFSSILLSLSHVLFRQTKTWQKTPKIKA